MIIVHLTSSLGSKVLLYLKFSIIFVILIFSDYSHALFITVKRKKMLKKTLLLLTILSLSTLYANDNILLYNAYGNAHHILIQGRMEEKKTFSQAKKDDSWFQNLWRTLRQVKGEEIKNRTIFALVNGEKFQSQGDDEGYFSFDITTQHALKTGYEKIILTIEGNSDASEAEAMIVGSEPLVGIISDFDDTIIVSNVTNKVELGYNTVFKNYKQRTVVPTMLERFKKSLHKIQKMLLVHFLSSLVLLNNSFLLWRIF